MKPGNCAFIKCIFLIFQIGIAQLQSALFDNQEHTLLLKFLPARQKLPVTSPSSVIIDSGSMSLEF